MHKSVVVAVLTITLTDHQDHTSFAQDISADGAGTAGAAFPQN